MPATMDNPKRDASKWRTAKAQRSKPYSPARDLGKISGYDENGTPIYRIPPGASPAKPGKRGESPILEEE